MPITIKAETYKSVQQQILAVLDGEVNQTARMATISCLLSHAFPNRFYWTGFYLVDPLNKQELVVGPYQGTLGCLRIPFGRGVCGSAALTGEIQIVADVHKLENHIACDPNSNSEIVIPVYNNQNELIAVFDVDSGDKNAFDQEDAEGLHAILKHVFEK